MFIVVDVLIAIMLRRVAAWNQQNLQTEHDKKYTLSCGTVTVSRTPSGELAVGFVMNPAFPDLVAALYAIILPSLTL